MVIVYRQLVALAFAYPMEEGKRSGREKIAAVLHCIVKLQVIFRLKFCPHFPTPNTNTLRCNAMAGKKNGNHGLSHYQLTNLI